MTWPAVVAWIIIFVGILPRSPIYLLYIFFGLGAFKSLSMLPAGNVVLVPQACCGVFLVCKVLYFERNLPRAVDTASDPAKLGLLFAFLFYSLFATYVMPRFFAHMVEVVSMNFEVPWATLLAPAGSNIAQSCYMMMSVGIALVFTLYGESAYFRRHYMWALLIEGFILIASGLADMTLGATGLLEPFRNAYVLLVEAEVLGSKRVVGLTPEASSFGSACVGAMANLVFLRPCFENARVRDYLVPLAILGLLTMAALSTSSSAYVGLVVFAICFAANWLRRAWSHDAPNQDGIKWEAILTLLAALVFLAVIAMAPHALDYAFQMIDTAVFKKTELGSYEERTMWTKVALNAFFATNGLGVGLGSVRTSNWFVNILASTGVIGAALLSCFIMRVYLRRCRAADPRIREFVTALRFGMMPQFATAALAGTTPDIGIDLASSMGLITSLTSTNAAESLGSRPRRPAIDESGAGHRIDSEN